MRYARHLIAATAALGFSGAAYANPQESEQPAQEPEQAYPAQPQAAPQHPVAPGEQELPCCEEPPRYQPAPQPQARVHKHNEKWRDVFAPNQVAIVIGGGGVDFMRERLSGLVLPGAMWNARLTIGTRSWVAFEAAYVGTANKLIGPNASEPQVIGNGFESDLRINFWRGRVQPYGFGGVGYNHFSLNNRDANPQTAAIFRNSSNQLMVPAGAGLSGYLGRHFVLDGRFTYRALFDQKLVLVDEPRTDQWTVQANMGVAF